jgi:hypothetical protein
MSMASLDAIYECTFTLIALDKPVETFSVSSDNDISNFVYTFIMHFDNVDLNTGKFDIRQTAHIELKKRVIDFLNDLSEDNPKAKRVISFFNHLANDEPFIIFAFDVPDTAYLNSCFNYLRSRRDGKDFDQLERNDAELVGDFLSKYEFHHLGSFRKNIGEPDKTKRICRFCNNASVPLTFNSKAHAISEALGNKTLILFDECDSCNQRFSKGIEQDFIEYYSLVRLFFKIKGKNGLPSHSGANFKIENSNDGLKIIYSVEEVIDISEDIIPDEIPLISNRKISKQNVYRTLVKYFLSVIDKSQLIYFNETIKWINGGHSYNKLPLVARIDFIKVAEQPTLVYYIRKIDDDTLPYAVAEFHFALYKICYIIPGSSMDKTDFTNPNNYQHFRKNFKHHYDAKGWSFEDFSDDQRRTLQQNLKVEVKKTNKPKE